MIGLSYCLSTYFKWNQQSYPGFSLGVKKRGQMILTKQMAMNGLFLQKTDPSSYLYIPSHMACFIDNHSSQAPKVITHAHITYICSSSHVEVSSKRRGSHHPARFMFMPSCEVRNPGRPPGFPNMSLPGL